MAHMRQNGFTIHEDVILTPEELEMFYDRHPDKFPLKEELTPLEEIRVKWLGHLLAEDMVTADDFGEPDFTT